MFPRGKVFWLHLAGRLLKGENMFPSLFWVRTDRGLWKALCCTMGREIVLNNLYEVIKVLLFFLIKEHFISKRRKNSFGEGIFEVIFLVNMNLFYLLDLYNVINIIVLMCLQFLSPSYFPPSGALNLIIGFTWNAGGFHNVFLFLYGHFCVLVPDTY